MDRSTQVTKARVQGRLSFLDFIRGIAALSVCFEHGGYRLWPQFRHITHDYFSFGKFGVAAFFLTSGFVIPYSLEKTNSLRQFWVSRFFRLYPLYWFSIAAGVSLLYCGLANITDVGFPVHVVKNTLINLTMLQAYFRVPNVLGLYYTLAMEMAFYIGFSLLFLKGLNRRSMPIAWLASGGVAFVAILIPLILHRRVPLAGLFYFLCLAVGTSMFRHFSGEVSLESLAALIAFIGSSTIVEVYCNYVLIKKNDPLEQFTFSAVFAPWAAAFIVFLAAYCFRYYAFPRFFVWLGLISYSVYLLHSPLLAVVPVLSSPALSLLLMLTVILSVSTCTYWLIERPGVALGKKLVAKSNAVKLRLPVKRRKSGHVPAKHASSMSPLG